MKHIIALVGMPGAGKSEAAAYLKTKDIPFIRFGNITEVSLKEKGLPITPENERRIREELRNDLGMAAYAIKAKPLIDELTESHQIIGLDGLYSWEEYKYLLQYFPQLLLVHIAAGAKIRYVRLSRRAIRPLTSEQARERDIAELEKLNKGGPIAIADYLIKNETTMEEFTNQIEHLLQTIQK
jgi:dephospho-CoA kinase